MQQQTAIDDKTLQPIRPSGWLKRFVDFWMPVFDVERCLPEWAEKHLTPVDAQSLHVLSGDAYERERQFHFKRAHSGLIGEHVSPFKGQGMDFSELREYAPGDDIRKLDWQVFARTQVPHIRDYKEERQLTVWLVLEDSHALGLGPAQFCSKESGVTPLSDKRLRAYELALRLGRIAKSANAKIGFFLATSFGYLVIKPSMGQAQLIRIAELLFSHRDKKDNRLPWVSHEAPMTALQNLVLKQDWVLVLADTSCINDAWVKPFGLMSHHSPINVFSIHDRREWQVPKPLESMPLVAPSTGDLKAKLPKHANSVDLYDRKFLESHGSLMHRFATVFSVDASASLEEVLHQWASGIRGPLKKSSRNGGR